jgi:membrane-bound metal-dependent hydrolase YbcI (DUF457 family)
VFIGHALLAFAIVAAIASARLRPERAVALGAVAGVFATIPDVDIAYAFAGVLGAGLADASTVVSTFWRTGNLVHRAVTHSLVVAPVVALTAGLWVARHRRAEGGFGRAALGGSALVTLAALVGVATAASGILGGAVMALFGLAALATAEATARRTAFSPATIFAAALVGLASHPFGDLTTGEPPAMLYPFDAALVAHRIALSADPTLHLLAAFALELGTVWLAVAVYARLTGRSLVPLVNPRAAIGVGYAATALLIPAPTLDLSYPFVFSVLAVGLVGAVPRVRLRRESPLELPDRLSAVVTALSAVTLAGLAYAATYLAGL